MELKKVFSALGRMLIENDFMFKSFLLLTFAFIFTIVIYICKD